MPDEETRDPINNLTKKSNSLDNLNFDALKVLFKPHIESFDHLIEAGLETIFKSIKLAVVHPTTFQKLINILFFFSVQYFVAFILLSICFYFTVFILNLDLTYVGSSQNTLPSEGWNLQANTQSFVSV